MEYPSSMGTSSVTTLNQYKKRAKAEASTRLNNSLVEASTV